MEICEECDGEFSYPLTRHHKSGKNDWKEVCDECNDKLCEMERSNENVDLD